MRTVVVSGTFDNLRSRHVRFLEEARKLGDSLHVLLWAGAAAGALEGQPPRFPESERRYLLEAIRFVDRVWSVDGPLDRFSLPRVEGLRPSVWAGDGPDSVHKADGLQEIAALALRKPGRLTLQRARGRAGPEQNVQRIAQLAGLFKKAHVAGTEVIEGPADDHGSHLTRSPRPA